VGDETVRKYKADLTDEIEPAIFELIELAEQGLKSLQKKEAVLKTKVRGQIRDEERLSSWQPG
jgi:DASH complex subunit SPC19